MDSGEPLILEPALRRVVRKALADEQYAGIFEQLCEELVAADIPLLRAHLTMHALHPLVSSVDVTWYRGEGLEVNTRAHSPAPVERWLRSPLRWLLSEKQWELRQDMRDDEVVRRFDVFEEFRARGGTDYLALLTPFGDPETAFERREGIVTSWISDAPEGFCEQHVDTIRNLQPYVGLISKLSKQHYTARNVLSAYLGEGAGRRVLEGQIQLGDVDHIPAVIWFSDLRDSTAMAERMQAEAFLQAVNAYFGCAAGAILNHGGEVLRFIGDAVLAVFPVSTTESTESAAHKAIAASREARRRLKELNERRADQSEEQLAFGLGLHVGELLYGNIGVPTRIEFSVIGPAANEVARLEGLTKETREPVLVSRAFKEAVDLPWRRLGVFPLKGVSGDMEVFAPPDED